MSYGATFAGVLLGLLSGMAYASKAAAEVVTYPAPAEEKLSTDYTIEVDGKSVPVYVAVTHFHDRKYSFAYFDFSRQARVTIKTARPLDHLAILPDKYGFIPMVGRDQATFTVDKPFSISFEPTGMDSPLELFGNSIETDAPKPGDPNVVYFGPGFHEAGAINLRTGQTLYIAGGAVVHGAVSAQGDNIRILGHGILDGSEWTQRTAPADHLVDMYDGHNIVLRDLICRGAFHWTIVPQRCRNVTIDNIRLCGSRVGNDDGIDACNCQDVTIENCFLRTDDDSIAIKGTTDGPNENIDIHDCTFWTEYANVFRIGAESRALYTRHITARNIDVIHSLNPNNRGVQIFAIQPGGNQVMEDFLFENIRINGEFSQAIVKLAPLDNSPGWGAGLGRPRVSTTEPYQENAPGTSANGGKARGLFPVSGDGPYIHNIVFRNIQVYGEQKGAPDAIILTGLDVKRSVDGVTFDHVTRYGVPLTADSPGLRIGQFASHVQFSDSAPTTQHVADSK